jgi:hypothetical protein
LLQKLDDLGIADDTIVIWTTDNGAEMMSWPDGGTTPFRGEKNTNWEGGYRVPITVRWPGVIKPGTEINDIISHEDWLPTLLAAAGQPDVKAQLLKGASVGGTTYKVHLDGYNLLPALSGQGEWPRKEFLGGTAFGEVMRGCADREDTWIDARILRVYTELHKSGHAHSCEVWMKGVLAGGVYGVHIGGAFFAESMFHRVTGMSKVALWALVKRLRERGFTLLEVQYLTPHLASLGAVEVGFVEYERLLASAIKQKCAF